MPLSKRMGSKRIDFIWLSDEDAYLETLSASSTHPDQNQAYSTELLFIATFLRRVVVMVVSFLVVASTALPPDYWLHVNAWAGAQATIDEATDAWRSKDNARYESLIDDEADEEWQRQIRDHWQFAQREGELAPEIVIQQINLFDELVWATVHVTYTLPAVRTFQTRRHFFFRQTESNDWLMTYPGEAFWGEERTLETAHLSFTYFARDAATVEATAPRIEEALLDIYQLLSIVPPLGMEKTNIEVLTWWPREGNSYGGTITVVSNLANYNHLSDSEEEAFIRHMAYPLVSRILDDFYREQRENSGLWPLVSPGVQYWLSGKIIEQPRFWNEKSSQILQERLRSGPPVTLPDLTMSSIPNETAEEFMWRSEVSVALLNFIYAEHRTAGISRFLRALPHHSDWAALTHALYDTPQEAFEQAWNQYMAIRYND